MPKLGEREYSTEDMIMLAAAVALDKKATRPVAIDLRNQGAFTDYFLVVSADNPRQTGAIADAITQFFKQTFGLAPISVDGLEVLTWVLVDYGSFFIHVFQEPTRELYKLEQLWSKGRIMPLGEESLNHFFAETKQRKAEFESSL